MFFFFFFSSRRRHTRFSRDWSSDVCSSDLLGGGDQAPEAAAVRRGHPARRRGQRDRRPQRGHGPAAGLTDPGRYLGGMTQQELTDPAWSDLTHLECSRCTETYDAGQRQGLCGCGAPLLARYDLAAAAAAVKPEQVAARPPDLWRYHELLPAGSAAAVVSLGEGMTPLLALPRLGAALGLPGLLLKDEG